MKFLSRGRPWQDPGRPRRLVGWSRTSRTRARKQFVGWLVGSFGFCAVCVKWAGSLVKPPGASSKAAGGGARGWVGGGWVWSRRREAGSFIQLAGGYGLEACILCGHIWQIVSRMRARRGHTATRVTLRTRTATSWGPLPRRHHARRAAVPSWIRSRLAGRRVDGRPASARGDAVARWRACCRRG